MEIKGPVSLLSTALLPRSAVAVAPAVPEQRRVGAMGHSIVSAGVIANQFDGSRAGGACMFSSYSFLGMSLPLAQGQCIVGGTYATPGYTSTQVVATHLPTALASIDDVIIVDMFTNDLSQLSWATSKANHLSAVNQLLLANKAVVLLTGWPYGGRTDSMTTTSGSPVVTDAAITALDIGRSATGAGIPANTFVGPSSVAGVSIRLSSSATSQIDVNATASATISGTVGAITAAQQLMQLSFMEWAKRQASQVPGVYVADTYAWCVDPSSAVGGWRAGYSADGIHPSPAAIIAVAPYIAETLTSIPGAINPSLAAGYNPSLKFADASFQVTSGWSLAGAGAYTNKPPVFPAQWIGSRPQLTGNAAGNKTLTAVIGQLTSGNRLRVTCKFECTGIGTNWSGLYVFDSVTFNYLCGYSACITLLDDCVMSFEFDVPAGIGTNSFSVNFQATGVGTVISLAQLTVVDLTALNSL